MDEELSQDIVTFGAYKGKHVHEMLKNRGLCKWLLQQDWFERQYEYLYRRVADYNPQSCFLKTPVESTEFVDSYPFFNLVSPDEVETPIGLTDTERTCYKWYVKFIDSLRERIRERELDGEENIYNIKAPVRSMQSFERDSGMSREVLKEFLQSHDLLSVATIVEDVKKAGGVEYKGRRGFLIAKKRSLEQEAYWEGILKDFYREDLGSQFKFDDCLFDFIVIPSRTVYECKLGLKDYQDEQYAKYIKALNGRYNVIYLIGRDTVVDMNNMKVYTSNLESYTEYLDSLVSKKKCTKLDELLPDFEVVSGSNIHISCLCSRKNKDANSISE